MSTSSIAIRPLASAAEYSAYYRLADTAFSSHPSEESARRWQHVSTQSPEFRAEQIRGAFRDGQYMGGYTIHERSLCMGTARISTGCIAAVVTAPDYRKQGVGSLLLQDALDFARENNHALLLLDGIPNFYFRYGYTDMFDVSVVEVDCSAILAQTAPVYQVRLATDDDADALLDLYDRHCRTYTGSFERSPEFQKHRLRNRHLPLAVAVSPQGRIEGYLLHGMDDEVAQGNELAADNWDALLALLHYHARLCSGDAAPSSLRYYLPLSASMTHWLIDKLEVPDTSQWHSPAEEWSVRAMAYHHRFAGWMACLADYPLLMNSMLPELRARWQRSLARWDGEIMLTVERQHCILCLSGAGVQIVDISGANAYGVELTPQALIQLIFGYRPLPQLASISHLPDEARAALAILFPPNHTWIPRTDWF